MRCLPTTTSRYMESKGARQAPMRDNRDTGAQRSRPSGITLQYIYTKQAWSRLASGGSGDRPPGGPNRLSHTHWYHGYRLGSDTATLVTRPRSLLTRALPPHHGPQPTPLPTGAPTRAPLPTRRVYAMPSKQRLRQCSTSPATPADILGGWLRAVLATPPRLPCVRGRRG